VARVFSVLPIHIETLKERKFRNYAVADLVEQMSLFPEGRAETTSKNQSCFQKFGMWPSFSVLPIHIAWILLKYAMHIRNIIEDCENYKKLTLQCMRIKSCQSKKILEEWGASMSNNYHASW